MLHSHSYSNTSPLSHDHHTRDVGLKSRLTYSGQSGMVTDLCMCDNSHSVASASSNGSVHVFKVEYGRVSRTVVDSAGMPRSSSMSNTTLRVVGTSMVRKVNAQKEGAVVMIRHYTTHLESVLVYATQMGHIHGTRGTHWYTWYTW